MSRWVTLLLLPAIALALYAVVRRPLLSGMHDGTIPFLEAFIGDRGVALSYWQEKADYLVVQVIGITWTLLAAFGLRSHPVAACTWLALLGLGCVALAGTHPFATQLIAKENTSVIDFCTAPVFLLGSVAMAVAALRSRGSRRRWTLLMAVFLLVCGGEEMSYLQHALDYETPELVRRHNEQGEFNLHNQFESKVFDTIFLASVLFFFLILPSFAEPGRPRPRTVRTFFVLAVCYFAARVFLPDDRDMAARVWFYPGLLGLSAALCLWGPHLCTHGPPGRIFRGFNVAIDMGRGLRIQALVLTAVWIIAGLRFGSLGDLRFLVTGLGYSNDNEIFELYAAALFLRLAWVQMDAKSCVDSVLNSDHRGRADSLSS